jgi:RNA polymerase sigma-70 factor (ECF subfamily)
MESDLDELVGRYLAAGDESAFNALHHAVYPDLVRYISTIVGPDDADDVVEEAFLALVNQRFDPARGAVRAWLFACARHRAITLLRRRGRDVPIDPVAADGDLPALIDTVCAPGLTPEGREMLREYIFRIRRSLEKLRPLERECVTLADGEGLSAEEIRQIVGGSIERVWRYLSEARAALAQMMAPDPYTKEIGLALGRPGLFPCSAAQPRIEEIRHA